MNDSRCPSCRGPRHEDAAVCPRCGWIPLQATELRFFEGEQDECPDCGAARSAADEPCPNCGSRQRLAPLSPAARSFHLSSMLVLTTFVAVCIGMWRITPPLGVLTVFILSSSCLYAAMMIRERKRHRYPTTIETTWLFFVRGLQGVLAASFVFAATCLGGGLFVGAVLSVVADAAEEAALALGVTLLVVSHAAAISYFRRRAGWRPLAAGVAAGGAVAMLSLWAEAAFGRRLDVDLLAFTLPAAMLPAAIAYASRRGGGHRAILYVAGHSTGVTTGGLLGLLYDRHGVVELLVLSGTLLVPLVVSLLTLQRTWSWEDAFPGARAQPRPSRRVARPSFAQSVVPGEPEGAEGIDFMEQGPDAPGQ